MIAEGSSWISELFYYRFPVLVEYYILLIHLTAEQIRNLVKYYLPIKQRKIKIK